MGYDAVCADMDGQLHPDVKTEQRQLPVRQNRRRHHEEGIEPEQDPADRRRPRAAPGLRRPAGAAGQPRHLRADLRRMRRMPGLHGRQGLGRGRPVGPPLAPRPDPGVRRVGPRAAAHLQHI